MKLIVGFDDLLLDIFLISLLKKCPYPELFWSVFPVYSWIRTEYGEIQSISLYSVRMQENTGRNNSKYRDISRSVIQRTSKGINMSATTLAAP